jgi:hypothetical protein
MALGDVRATPLPQAAVMCEYDGMRTAAGAMTGVSLSLGRGVDAARFAGVRGSYAGQGRPMCLASVTRLSPSRRRLPV